jgi:hypothetical protein
MALDQQLVNFFPHTVTISSFSSKNNYGEDAYGSTRTVKAYVEPNQTLSLSAETNEQTFTRVAYINDLTVTVRDKITLSDGTIPKIINIETHTEVLGLEHSVVRFT